MPAYTYEGDPERYYPGLGLTPEHGSSYELERNPGDGRWTPPDPELTPAATKPATAKKKTTREGGGSDA